MENLYLNDNIWTINHYLYSGTNKFGDYILLYFYYSFYSFYSFNYYILSNYSYVVSGGKISSSVFIFSSSVYFFYNSYYYNYYYNYYINYYYYYIVYLSLLYSSIETYLSLLKT